MSHIKDLFDSAMISLVLDFPIYAQLISRIGVELVYSGPAIAWTNGRKIFLNMKRIEEINADPIKTLPSGEQIDETVGKKEIMFILSHELMHLLTLTYDRGKALGINVLNQDKATRLKFQLWNCATDYEINSLLHNNERNDGGSYVRAPVGNMPSFVLYESKYRESIAEDIYAELLHKAEDQAPNHDLNAFEDCSMDDLRISIGPEGDVHITKDGTDTVLDDHLPIEDELAKNEVLQKIADVLGSRGNGLGSSALERVLNRTFAPVPFNWRKALTKYIRGFMKSNYTWNKPNRAGIANNIILPSAGMTPRMHIAVAIDTSGSISDVELNTMMDHLFTILTQFKDFQIDVWCCGSTVYPETFRTYTKANKSELKQFPFQSDGGNDMRENFKFIKEHYTSNKPDVFICMSDFYDPLDGDTETTSPCPCIWLVLDHKEFVPPKLIKAETYPFTVKQGKPY